MTSHRFRFPARAARFVSHFSRATRAARYGRRHGLPGMAFDSFGRRCGLAAAVRGRDEGLMMLLSPVSIVRYWEFPFVRRHLPDTAGAALDVASPRLFSFYALERGLVSRVRMINPDGRDARQTADLARVLGIGALEVDEIPVADIRDEPSMYDVAWSISVIEHIPQDGDIEAVDLMWRALRPGGRLLITVPVDRRAWDEYRDHDTYQLGLRDEGAGYFFQRWYDAAAIRSRLLSRVGGGRVALEWFGERDPGHFEAYEREWLARGYTRTLDDAREIVDHYREYPDWESMPGRGVVGIAVEKA